MEYIILDWMGNVLFGGRTFPYFEGAWGFIYDEDPNTEEDDHYYDDYFVEEYEGPEGFEDED